MQLRLLAPIGLASLLSLAAVLPTADDTELAAQMELVEETVGKLRRSLRDPEKLADSLAEVAVLQTAIGACRSEEPKMTAGVPEEERAAFLNDYKADMAGLLVRALEIEIALRKSDHEAANEAFKALRQMEEPAHERFTEE